jgi:hypothetical protein
LIAGCAPKIGETMETTPPISCEKRHNFCQAGDGAPATVPFFLYNSGNNLAYLIHGKEI